MKKIFSVLFVTVLLVAMLLVGCITEPKIEAQRLDATDWTVLGEFDMDGLNATPMKEVALDNAKTIEVKVEFEAKDEIYMLAEIYYEDKDFRWPAARMIPLSKKGKVVVQAPVSPKRRFQILTQAFQSDCSYNGDYIVDKVKLSYRLVQ